jgi:hypothetical protein
MCHRGSRNWVWDLFWTDHPLHINVSVFFFDLPSRAEIKRGMSQICAEQKLCSTWWSDWPGPVQIVAPAGVWDEIPWKINRGFDHLGSPAICSTRRSGIPQLPSAVTSTVRPTFRVSFPSTSDWLGCGFALLFPRQFQLQYADKLHRRVL